jgi:hypothetical protein
MADLFFIAYEGIPDAIIRRTPPFDMDYWKHIEFFMMSDRPLRLVVETDSDVQMENVETFAETTFRHFMYTGGGERFVRGSFHIPEGVTDLEIWVKGVPK